MEIGNLEIGRVIYDHPVYEKRIAELEAALRIHNEAGRMAILAAAEYEREACAKIADGFAGQFEGDSGGNLAAECIAQAIRARAA